MNSIASFAKRSRRWRRKNIAYGIYPVISPVWAGFDVEWLREAITNHLSRHPIPGLVERALVWTSMHPQRAQWEALQREIQTLRDNAR